MNLKKVKKVSSLNKDDLWIILRLLRNQMNLIEVCNPEDIKTHDKILEIADKISNMFQFL